MGRRRRWLGIESIEDGDKIKWQLPSGITNKAVVYKTIGESLSPEYGVGVRFYSERVSHGSVNFHSFERVVPEEWITHWRGRRVRHRSSDSEIRPVDSSIDNGTDQQIVLPIQEGA